MRNSMVFDILGKRVKDLGLTIDSFKDDSFVKASNGFYKLHLYILLRDLYPSKERDWIEHWIRLCTLMLKFNTYKLFDKTIGNRDLTEKHRLNLIKEAVSMETRVKDINLPLEYIFLLLSIEDQNYVAINVLYELQKKPCGVSQSISYKVCRYLEEYLKNIDKPEIREKLIDLYDRFNLNMY